MFYTVIVGGGFAGTLTAIQLIEKSEESLAISIINDSNEPNTGVAFSPNNKKHLLNVVTQKMSAFPDKPDHFLDWVMQQPFYCDMDISLVAQSFMPRAVYGVYLKALWTQAKELARKKGIRVEELNNHVIEIEPGLKGYVVKTKEGKVIICHAVVLATGNQLPRNHGVEDNRFYDQSSLYYRNPWQREAIENLPTHCPVLIIGNGLTMVDTVSAIMEQGYPEQIISVSPNGFQLLPHRHTGMEYKKLETDIQPGMSLNDWVCLINKHRKLIRQLGISAEPIIDAIRPITQDIWMGLSLQEKRLFLRRLNPVWNVARHRVPLHIHDSLQQWRFAGKLQTYAGRIVSLTDAGNFVRVVLRQKTTGTLIELEVSRIINCSGPEADVSKMEKGLLATAYDKGLLRPDEMRLGLDAHWPSMRLYRSNGQLHKGWYTLGTNLRGVLWESTSVKEIREQADLLATQLLLQKSTTKENIYISQVMA